MSQLRGNTNAFIEAEVYSKFILENLPAYQLPEGFYRDVSDFGQGTTLNIKTIGDVTIQDAAEDTELTATPIDTGTVTLNITDYKGDAWFVTDELRQDGSQIDKLMGARAVASTRALAEDHETNFLKVAGVSSQAQGTDLNLVNSRPHRWIAGGSGVTTRVMSMGDLIAAKLAFDKANIPAEGRIAIVDPIVEATLNSLSVVTSLSNSNARFDNIVSEGFVRTHKFVTNLFGFDIWTSNFLPRIGTASAINASGYNLASTTTDVADVVNIFMCIADDNTKPIMHAWRQQPKTEGWRDHAKRSDRFQVTSRFGFGAQRLDSLITIISSSTAY